MSDAIVRLGKSLIQHGGENSRVYLMKASPEDFPEIVPKIDTLCEKNGYGKAFAKTRADNLPFFLRAGYRIEGFIPGFYNGHSDGLFLGKYFSDKRKRIPQEELNGLAELLRKPFESETPPLPPSYRMEELGKTHLEAMTELFGTVFPVYPFPIHDTGFLAECMDNNVRYFGVFSGERLVALSSAEMDREGQNAEMTDFAVHPDQRGKGLALLLLRHMEQAVLDDNILTAYTIARLKSLGMNRTFQKAGYRYSGTLLNNTKISTGIESMNIWYKRLPG